MLDQFVVDLSSPGARRLFHYWVHGEGAVKIRWGTDGSFDRCVRHLRDKVRDPQGLCAEYHKAATGEWPAEKGIQSAAGLTVGSLLRWRALLTLIGKSTGDKRKINPGALSTRNLPLPLLWQRQTVAGKHDGAVVVGLIDKVEISADAVYGEGELFTPDPLVMPRLAEDVAELRYITERGLGGPSVDIQLDDLVFEYQGNEAVVTQGRIAAATLVQVPAFAETKGAFEIYDHEGTLLASVGVMRPFELITLEQWEESKHPRDAEGKFKEKPGGAPDVPDVPAMARQTDFDALLRKFSDENEFGTEVRESLAVATSSKDVDRILRRELQKAGVSGDFYVDLGALDVDTAKEYAEGTLRVLEIFPDTYFVGLRTHHIGSQNSELAHASWERHVSFNAYWSGKRREKMRIAAREDDKGGFHPPRNSSVMTAVHELIHTLHQDLALGPQPGYRKKESEDFARDVYDLIEDLKLPDGNRRGFYDISTYGDKDIWELVAEAGSDVFINGEKASPASKRIFQLLIDRYKRRGYKLQRGEEKQSSPQQKTTRRVIEATRKILEERDPSDLLAMSKKDMKVAMEKLKLDLSDDPSEMLMRLRLVKHLQNIDRPPHIRRLEDFVERLMVRDRESAVKVLDGLHYPPKEIARFLKISVKRGWVNKDIEKAILDRLFPEPVVEEKKPEVVEGVVRVTGSKVKVGDEVVATPLGAINDKKLHRVAKIEKRYGRLLLKDDQGRLIADVAPNQRVDLKPGKEVGPSPEPGPKPEPVLGEDDYGKFRYALELKRDRAGSVAALAKELGVNSSTLSGWLKGRKPRDKALVAKILGEKESKEIKINAPEVDRVNGALEDLINNRDRTRLDRLSTEDLRAAVKLAQIKGVRGNASRDTLIKKLLQKMRLERPEKPGFGSFVDQLFAVSRTEGRKMLRERGPDLLNIADEAGVEIEGVIFDDEAIIKKILGRIHAPDARIPDPVPPEPDADVPDQAKPYHLHVDGMEDLVRHVESGFEGATRKRIRKGNQGGVKEVITTSNGKKIFSRQTDRDKVTNQDAKTMADREQLAARLGQVLSAPVPRVYRTADNQVYADYVSGRLFDDLGLAGEARDRYMDSREGKLIALLDMLIGNGDRHGYNMVVTPNGKLVGLDHGFAFHLAPDMFKAHSTPGKEAVLWQVARGPTVRHFLGSGGRKQWLKDNPLTQQDVEHIRRELDKLEPEFKKLGRGDWLKFARQALELMEPYAKGKKNMVAPERPASPGTSQEGRDLERFQRNRDMAEMVDMFRAGDYEEKLLMVEGGRGGKQRKIQFPDGRALFMKDMSRDVQYDPEGVVADLDREELAALVAEAVEARVPRLYRDSDTRIFTEWVDGMPASLHYDESDNPIQERIRVESSPAKARLGVLDALITNEDRYGLNEMIDNNGELVGIDHGDAWNDSALGWFGDADEEQRYTDFIYSTATGVRDDDGYIHLNDEDFARIRERLEDLRPEFERRDREHWLDHSLAVLSEMEKIKHPEGKSIYQETARTTAPQDTYPDDVPNLYDEASYPEMSDETRQRLARAFEGTHAGLTTKIEPHATFIYKLEDGVEVRVYGSVTGPDGDLAGSFEVKLSPGTKTAHIDSLAIDEKYHKRGFATSFNRQMEAQLEEDEYERITISPAFAGGYAWARAGFDWRSDHVAPLGDVPTRILDKLMQGDLAFEYKTRLESWLKKFQSQNREDWPSPQDIAGYGELGRGIMDGASWSGEKRL